MKPSTTLSNWMKSQYGQVPKDFDQHYANLTKELSAHGPITDVDMAAMINHRANMDTQGRPVPMNAAPMKPPVAPGMQAILAKMQAHGSTLPHKVQLMRQMPHLEAGGVIPPGGSAVVGDNQADPSASTPEVATNTPAGTVIQPAPQAASVPAAPIPAGQDPNTNGSASQLLAATEVASKLTGLSPQAVAQVFDPAKLMSLYQAYQAQINGTGQAAGRSLAMVGANLAGPNQSNSQIAQNAASDAATKNAIMGPQLQAMQTMADQQNQDRLNAPILAAGAQTAINQPTANSTNATTQSTNALTQLQNQGAMALAKQAQDATSPFSQGLMSIGTPLLQKLGVTVPPGMSAAAFTSAFGGIPQIAKLVQDYTQQQINQQNANSDTAKANAAGTEAAASQQNAATRAAEQTAQSTGSQEANQTQAKNDADANTDAKEVLPAANASIAQLQDTLKTIQMTDPSHFGVIANQAANFRMSAQDRLLQQKLNLLKSNALAGVAKDTGAGALRGQKIDLTVMGQSPSITDDKATAMLKIQRMLDTAIKAKEAASNVVGYYGKNNSLKGYNPDDQSTYVSVIDPKSGETSTIPRNRAPDAAKAGMLVLGLGGQ